MTTTAPHAQPATDAPVNPAGLPTAYEHGNRLTAEGTSVDPILVEIVQGTLASVEMEVETAIARTSRSPMIRDAHDFRAGIHDRRLRKLTGRSYSALVHPVVRDHPIDTMKPGDVFFHNDVYLSEGGIGHLPDLCVTVPVFHEGEVVAFVQAFGHHDDIGGACPGSMPSGAQSVYEEGLAVPPIKLWDAGKPNQAALRIMTRSAALLGTPLSHSLIGGTASPSSKTLEALLGIDPGTAPPMSSWWPKAWTKATTSPSWKTGTVTQRSGRWPMPPSDS